MSTVEAPQVPALVVGTVSHVRRAPLRHAFENSHYQWLVDLDEVPRLAGPLRWIARFDERDHLDGGQLGGGIRGDLTRWLAGRGVVVEPEDRVLMLAHARILGHVFDPLSVFWCVRPNGSVRAVVFEVHNTYGERHAYLVEADERGRARLAKEFYVSPFNDTQGTYDVTWRLTPEKVQVSVSLERGDERIFTAVTTGRAVPFTTGAFLRTFSRHLFMTHRVSLLIRWHGIRLWLARLAVQPRPAHSQEAVR